MAKVNGNEPPPTPWAVLCPEHGQVFLAEAEYMRQLGNPNALWRCPCGRTANWDDDNYDAAMEALEAEAVLMQAIDVEFGGDR